MEKEQRIGNSGSSLKTSLLEQAIPLNSDDTIDAQDVPAQEVQGFAKTLEFLQKATAEGAHLKQPKWRGAPNEYEWVRQKNVVGVYFGSPAVIEDIRKIYGSSNEVARRTKNKGVHNLWKNCRFATRRAFPLKELILEKPLSQRSRERMSRAKGGKTIFVREQLEAGKSIEQLQGIGITIRQIKGALKTLRSWGYDAPYPKTPYYQNKELERKLRDTETDQEKQKLLNQVKYKLYDKHVKGENPLFVNITDIAWEAGFKLGFQKQNVALFFDSLRKADVPNQELQRRVRVGTEEEKVLIYRFILFKDKERAKEILLGDPDLQRFRRS